jgi:hypothetical protein
MQWGRRSVNELFAGMIAGVFGTAYFVHGKRQTKFAPMICGVALCGYPYFIDSLVWLCVIGAVLLVVPFVTDF